MNFANIVTQLSDISDSELYHYAQESTPFPSADELHDIVDLCRDLLFPGYYGRNLVKAETLSYYIGVKTERLYEKLAKQILAGMAFTLPDDDERELPDLWTEARHKSCAFVETLPKLRQLLATDVVAHYRNDPAAHNTGEVILCYPGLRAVINYRIAHRLVELNVPLIPRMITEMAHSETSIDIHPAATIGESFTIDHGTGVVIGATAILGNHVTIYQGVTLGAKNFPQEADGSLVKGIARHPILGNNVIVYANATILGRIRIGDGSVIGGNLWVTDDVPAGTKLFYHHS
jgi:serine O-acetyltransferase